MMIDREDFPNTDEIWGQAAFHKNDLLFSIVMDVKFSKGLYRFPNNADLCNMYSFDANAAFGSRIIVSSNVVAVNVLTVTNGASRLIDYAPNTETF